MPSTGKIVPAFREARDVHGFKTIFGDDASIQPGKLQELMLHETAVSWLRLRLARSVPPKPWLETREGYARRLKACCGEINEKLDVRGLCHALLPRVDALVEAEGGRLRH